MQLMRHSDPFLSINQSINQSIYLLLPPWAREGAEEGKGGRPMSVFIGLQLTLTGGGYGYGDGWGMMGMMGTLEMENGEVLLFAFCNFLLLLSVSWV